ncbi:LOW QUALITY PROTEIN: putative leucine-rich repeat-containing protein DDB_G0290503 [Haliotis rubra]|uniref:LOW QUALITY PROTEIN: putative leucine-rich repeat-containing protein DDB_G0290503 n=1 Tax=Haliotis rubra TaxID=36100 RepID=UPI001EE5BD66|nr:LOW QUALITY PROTEIN: putative leucine-rich repeat-containing protein DDB_G0290503 [Haliotis rubra]
MRRRLETNNRQQTDPGYFFFNYLTPSQRLEQGQKQHQLPNGNTSVTDNTTVPQSSRSQQGSEGGSESSPGYGVFDYTTPSQLMWARENTPSGSGLVSDVSGARPLVPGLGTFSYTTPSQLRMQTQPYPPDCRENSESGLIQTAGNKPGTKQDLDPALSDITTYFRRLSDMLIKAFPYSESYSEPEFIKQHPDSSRNRFFPQGTDSNSDSGQRQPMPSQPLSVTGSTSSNKTFRPSTGMSTDSGFGHSSRDSVSSLSYPDSVLTPRESSLRVTSNLSFESYSDDELPAEEKRTIPKGLHSALSANEIFWELFNANPSLSLHVLGAEFDTAVQALNQLYDSYCSGNPSSPPIPAYPVVPRGPVSASALSTASVNPAAPSSFQMKPDMHTSQDNFAMEESRPCDIQHKMSSSMSISPRTAASDMRSFMVEKEKMESQMRKLQVENSTLVTENKLMKEKFNRASAKVADLEQKLTTAHNEMDSLQTSMTTEISTLYDKTRSETQRDMDQFQTRIVSLTRHNETLQAEVLSLEKQLESSQRESDAIRAHAERSRAIEAYKLEANSLKTELDHVKMLLHQSESQVKAEIDRAQNAQLQVVKLTEIRNLLQQQIDSGGMGSSVAEKQVQALEQRLRVTEDRLHQERADRANSLSTVEEKLLSENARLQSSEKGLTRQLQREKDKSRNLDQRCRELKVENENLRLSVPLDDTYLINDNTNIPCNKQSSQKQEQKKVSDIKFILSEMEKQAGLTADQEKEIICHLWNTCDSAQRQLQQWELHLVDLELCGEDVEQGLQNLREMKGEYENKLHQVEEKIEDVRSEKMAFENTYKEQLSVLVKEKHEACARLQTLEDMMEAMKKENDMLRFSLASSAPECNAEKVSAQNEARVESLTLEIQNLTGQTAQLHRNSQQMQTEIETLRSQLQSRDQELQETRSQLDIAQSHHTDDSDNRRQHKIDQLVAKVSSLQDEVKSLSDRLGSVKVENTHLEKQLEDANRQLTLTKSRSRDLMAAGTTEAKVRVLEAEMAQKERELLKMTAQFHESDMALQQTRQDLGFHQQHIADLEGQVESLEQQVVQRGQMLEMSCGKEQEQLQQFQLVKDSLDAATNSLNHTRTEFNVIQLELSKERSRREAVEKELHHAQQPRDPDADIVAPGAGSAMEVRVQELEKELDRVRGQLVDAASVLQCKEEELSGERTETTRTREDLERERTTSCQVSAEKLQLHQQLKAVSEERNSLLEEKGQAEEDLVKLESRLQEVVHKYQMEASKQHDNFNTAYTESQTPQDQQMLSEVKSLRLLVEGREKESMSLNDKISRQQMEIGFLQRRIELLHQENQYNREDVRRLSSQLLQKMKEKTATVELNTYLAREKSTLQHENKQLTRDVERERDITHRRKAEVSEIIKKMEKTETSQRGTVQELHERQGHIASLDTDLRQAKRENSYLEAENQQLKLKDDQLKVEVQKLTSMIHSLENRLEMEQASLAGERNNYTKKKEELVSTQHKLDTLQREYKMLLNNLEAERRGYEQLKEELSSSEASEKTLREQLNSLQANHDSQRGQNLAHRDNLEQLQKEKTAIFQDYQDVCRQLGEKEKKMYDLRDECGRQVEVVRKDAALHQTRMNQEHESVDRDLKMYKEEINELNEKLRQKDVQLNAFGRTLTQLEDVTREKKALEVKLEKMESAGEETKNQLDSSRTEILGMKETHSQLQESLAKTQMNYLSAQEQLRTQTESTSGQVLHLKHTISELKNQHEGERCHLREALNQVGVCLGTIVRILIEMNSMQTRRAWERSFEEVKTQVAEEVMNRKLLEQKSESQKSHLEDTKKKKQSLVEKTAEQLARLARVESELQLERERVMTLTSQVQELQASLHGNQSAAKAKQEQVDILQREVGKLQHLLDSQKQQLGSKFRKANLDIKQQLETSESEKTKLSQEAQQLSVQLEQAREHIAIKNKENLRLQEEILSLEEQVRENSSQLKQAMDSLRVEEQMQSDLSSRFSEQEEELRRLRTFLAKKAEEGSGGENKGMWHEMNRVIQDLSRQMQQHLDSQKSSDKEARDREIKLANSFKKQVATLESELKTERALHQITRSSLKSQEDDNQRLRDQMFALRRKSISPEKKYKSRSEEINDLISRSQSRAQAILSSTGAYTDGTLKNISPTKDYNVNSNDLDRSQSPDTASQMSDISCGSNGPIYLAFLNSSGTWQTPGSGNVTPRKSP